MKKRVLFLLFALLLTVCTQHAGAQKVIQWPSAEMTYTTSTDQTTSAITVTNSFTWIKYGTLSGALTINVTASTGLKKGAILIIETTSDGTARDVTFGTGIDAIVQTGTISKTKTATFVYNGTIFKGISQLQID